MQFYDPAFDGAKEEITRLTEIAWQAYQDGRKSARTRPAGPDFAGPSQELSVEWLEARDAIGEAEKLQKSGGGDGRILVICASPRTDETCPSEMSKTFRIAKAVCEQIGNAGGFTTDLLDLSHLSSEYGRTIFPCKACVSTAMPLCHWPCSCYYEPYATSHEALDRDSAFLQEARNATTTLMEAVREMRKGREAPGHGVEAPRPK